MRNVFSKCLFLSLVCVIALCLFICSAPGGGEGEGDGSGEDDGVITLPDRMLGSFAVGSEAGIISLTFQNSRAKSRIIYDISGFLRFINGDVVLLDGTYARMDIEVLGMYHYVLFFTWKNQII